MHISKPQHRPPFDVYSPMLQIVEGCTHNKCHFCDIFRDVTFHMSPWDEIMEDVDEIAATSIATERRRIYLTGGNPYALPNSKLLPLLDEVKRRIPEVKEFGGFCRIADIARRTNEELQQLADYGVNMITIGAESGYDPALAFMEKGHTAADIIEQGKRMHAHGIKFCFFYLTGMAGAGNCEENAIASGKVFSEAAPDYILIVTITPTATWPLRQDIEDGLWTPPEELEMANEIRTFVANLDCETYVNCSHDTDVVRFDAKLPKDKENALQLMDHVIPKLRPAAARRMREFIHHAKF
ncbi:MAG: radical SAM protein [Coriobacteriia bacterium]|nr:radical SAM protein [Coriobacteriia bacterium]